MRDHHIIETRVIDGTIWAKIAYHVRNHPSIVNPYPQPRMRLVEQWHTYTCLLDFAHYYAEADLYRLTWPDHCLRCDGHGGTITTYDPSPAGVSLSPGYMEDFEPCGHCASPENILHAQCPRCGIRFSRYPDQGWLDEMRTQWAGDDAPSDTDLLEAWAEHIVCDEMPCPVCGWNWGHGKHDAIPTQPECACWHLKGNPDYPAQE